MQIQRFEVGSIQTNAWLVTDDGQGIVIDPGAEDEGLLAAARACTLVGVVLTHGHIDHIGGIKPFIEMGVPIYIGQADAEALHDPRVNLSVWLGSPWSAHECVPKILRSGDTLKLGRLVCSVIELPGHSPGSIGLIVDGHCFSGDVLFRGSVGRTDFPGGDPEILGASIKDILYSLPGNTIVHPGHGDDTTIAAEKSDNPFYSA